MIVPADNRATEPPVQRKEADGTEPVDKVDAASDDSFPASDAPAWTVLTAIGCPAQAEKGA